MCETGEEFQRRHSWWDDKRSGSESPPDAQEKVEIQPNKDFLGPKESFQVEVANLDTLLDYTEKDDREMTFEVLVFGELFKEMLQARFGCGILRTLEMLEKQDRQVKRFWAL